MHNLWYMYLLIFICYMFVEIQSLQSLCYMFIYIRQKIKFLVSCILYLVCVQHFYDLCALVGCWSLVCIRMIIYKFLNVCPFDYTAVATRRKVERSQTALTTPAGWLLLLQLHVLSRSAFYNRGFWWRFLGCYVAFLFFCECRGFCHRTEWDLILFPLIQLNKPDSF